MYGPENFDLFDLLGPFSLGGTRWLPVRPFSAIRGSSWCSHDVTDITLSLKAESSAAASYPLFWWLFESRHRYHVLPGGGAIRHSVISLILVPVFVAYRKSRRCGQHLCVPNPSVLHSRKCVRYAGTRTGSMCLQFGTSSGTKELTKELQLYKSTFPNRLERNFAHITPWSVRDRRVWARNC
jgi:hypothetical protein